MFDFILEYGVFYAFLVVVTAIVIDTILGAIKAAVQKWDKFDIRKLAQFLATGILPYVGSLGVLALAAEYIGDPFLALFYPAALAVVAKYGAEIKDKLTALLGVEIGKDGIAVDGSGNDEQ